MKRLTLLLAGGAIWLFLAAIPALADGGPHVAAINNGSLGVNADSCAGCHRAHTAQGPMLINAADEEALCLTCHGAASTGSTVDVMTGVQYTLGTDGLRDTAILGATRNGGFDQARIGASEVYRISTGSGALRTKVPVLATPEDVTSAHLALPENGLTPTHRVWGNGTPASGSGLFVEISCGTCHNPHGNGQYRILNPIPTPTVTAGTFTPVAAPGALVTDAALPPAGDTRNYTVIQTVASSPTLLASQVPGVPGYTPTAGDYFHRGVPWNERTNVDAPNGLLSFNAEITAWCSACHTRYYSVGNEETPSPDGDQILKYKHNTVSNRACTTCHVSHGSNASMGPDPNTGTTFAQNFPYPTGVLSDSSRLLKIDGRGTCQACHDPTGTFPSNSSSGPVPVPLVP